MEAEPPRYPLNLNLLSVTFTPPKQIKRIQTAYVQQIITSFICLLFPLYFLIFIYELATQPRPYRQAGRWAYTELRVTRALTHVYSQSTYQKISEGKARQNRSKGEKQ